MERTIETSTGKLPKWALALFPLVILMGLIAAFWVLDPLAFFTGSFPPLEELTIQQIRFPESGQMEVDVINGGPDPVTIAQVLIDDAYWQFEIEPGNTLTRLEQATIHLPYPWVDGEPLPVTLITNTGVTFSVEVEVAVQTPQTSPATFFAYGLLGIYVGVIPVALGMLWYPFMRRIERKWINAFLALTIGLLVFLFVDTILEALEIAATLPGVMQGTPLVIFGTLFSLGILLAVSQRRGSTPLAVAGFMALGIGLHNLGEGLAIGAAFATGAAALGSFLVIGFTLHNITEGVGIAAPLTRLGQRPSLLTFFLLAVLAGAPAMLGTWIGGFAFNPFLAVLFLSLGAGAILQVIVEVGKMLVSDSRGMGDTAVSWLNFAGLTAGILIMYLTAFLVKF
jgi:zinc transporter ZupT